MGFYPRLHPGRRAPRLGERILPNTHSKQNVVLPLSKFVFSLPEIVAFT